VCSCVTELTVAAGGNISRPSATAAAPATPAGQTYSEVNSESAIQSRKAFRTNGTGLTKMHNKNHKYYILHFLLFINCRNISVCQTHEKKTWLDNVQKTLNGNSDSSANGDLNLSWAAYHASMGASVDDDELCITSLLPLFSEDSKSVAMLRHSMDVISSSVRVLNGDQNPVIAVDQQLFAIYNNNRLPFIPFDGDCRHQRR